MGQPAMKWDSETSRWYYLCGPDKVYTEYQDKNGAPVAPPTEEKDDERISESS